MWYHFYNLKKVKSPMDSLSNSRRHSANADVTADVKS